MGTAGLACASLQALSRAGGMQVIAVVTQPDRPKGRDLKLSGSPVKELALKLNLTVVQPRKAREEIFIGQLRELQPDLIVVAAYGQILPESILNLPRSGCLNVHTSLLPKYRGAAPIQWAILDDEPRTGVTIMKMAAGLDTGDILTQRETPITDKDNAETLHDRLAIIGAELLVETIPQFVSGRINPRAQIEAGASYARKISKEDGLIDWSRPARQIWNRIRAFTPWPGTYTFHSSGGRKRLLKIHEAAVETTLSGTAGKILCADKTGIVVGCGEQGLRILSLQLEGGKKLQATEFLSGHLLSAGDQVG